MMQVSLDDTGSYRGQVIWDSIELQVLCGQPLAL